MIFQSVFCYIQFELYYNTSVLAPIYNVFCLNKEHIAVCQVIPVLKVHTTFSRLFMLVLWTDCHLNFVVSERGTSDCKGERFYQQVDNGQVKLVNFQSQSLASIMSDYKNFTFIFVVLFLSFSQDLYLDSQ